MVCSDCHDPHGQETGNLKEATVNLVCYRCHAEKQGPFAFEHPPVRENCCICHKPHGAVANNLLKQPPTFLCLRCHAGHNGRHRHPGVRKHGVRFGTQPSNVAGQLASTASARGRSTPIAPSATADSRHGSDVATWRSRTSHDKCSINDRSALTQKTLANSGETYDTAAIDLRRYHAALRWPRVGSAAEDQRSNPAARRQRPGVRRLRPGRR